MDQHNDSAPGQVEQWQAEAAIGDAPAPAPARKGADLRSPEMQAKARAGRERFWAARRAAKAAGQPPPDPKQRRKAQAPPPEERPVATAAVRDDSELMRWLAYQDGLLLGIAALIDESLRRLQAGGYGEPAALRKARDLLGELL